MKTTFTQTPYYHIQTDKKINRLYITILGCWPALENVEGFVNDIKEAIAGLSPSFTTLLDYSQCKPHPYAIASVHIAAHKLLVSSGVLQAAHFYKDMEVGVLAAAAGMMSQIKFKQYDSCSEAERCLNQCSASYLLDQAGMFFEMMRA